MASRNDCMIDSQLFKYWESIMKIHLTAAAIILATATGAQAASVVAATETGIVIKHTPFERKKIQQTALEHCLKNGRIAVLVNEAKGFPNATSTFVCN